MADATAKDQLGMDEKVIDDPQLNEALEELARAKEAAKEPLRKKNAAKARADAMLEGLDLGVDAPVRVGRFRVTLRRTEAQHREFDVEESERFTIKSVG